MTHLRFFKNVKKCGLAESAKVCLHLLPPISDHVTIHVGGYDCSFNEHTKWHENQTVVTTQVIGHMI